jgi:hypothetical protein
LVAILSPLAPIIGVVAGVLVLPLWGLVGGICVTTVAMIVVMIPISLLDAVTLA